MIGFGPFLFRHLPNSLPRKAFGHFPSCSPVDPCGIQQGLERGVPPLFPSSLHSLFQSFRNLFSLIFHRLRTNRIIKNKYSAQPNPLKSRKKSGVSGTKRIPLLIGSKMGSKPWGTRVGEGLGRGTERIIA